jgi:hypothetical protein
MYLVRIGNRVLNLDRVTHVELYVPEYWGQLDASANNEPDLYVPYQQYLKGYGVRCYFEAVADGCQLYEYYTAEESAVARKAISSAMNNNIGTCTPCGTLEQPMTWEQVVEAVRAADAKLDKDGLEF